MQSPELCQTVWRREAVCDWFNVNGQAGDYQCGETFQADDFYHRQYGIMFQAMVDMNNAAKPVDIVTLQEALKEKDVPPEVYSLEFIRELLAAVPTSANIRHYATIVKDKAILRNIIRVNDSIATACYEGKESTEDILAIRRNVSLNS